MTGPATIARPERVIRLSRTVAEGRLHVGPVAARTSHVVKVAREGQPERSRPGHAGDAVEIAYPGLWVADGVPHLRHTTYDAARAGARILATGWPDKDSVKAALVEPVEAIVVTRIFEEHAH